MHNLKEKKNHFRKDFSGLVVGGEDGIIRVYDLALAIDANSPQVLV